MSTFEYLNNKITRQVEHANRDQINRHGKNIADKPLTIEEMMKQRDAEMLNIKYNYDQCNNDRIKQFENKTPEERMSNLMNVEINPNYTKTTYICTLLDQNIDLKLLGSLECYPPIYEFGPGFSFLSTNSNEISLPSDFKFNPSHITRFVSNLTFVIKHGDYEFVNNYGNIGHMFIGTTAPFKYIEDGRCIKFIETSSNGNYGNCLYFEYNQKKNIIKFIRGSYQLTYDQCEILEGVSKNK
jgi:hypothetical protein